MFFDLTMTRLFEYLPKIIWPAIIATIKMLSASLVIGALLGLIVAIILVLTNPSGLSPNRFIYRVLNAIVDAIRSFPAIILIVALTPLTRLIIGTSVGWMAAVVPLTIAAFPAIARLIEHSLLEVDKNVILAAKSFGASNGQIIFKVMFVEATPSIVSNMTFASIQLLANTTLAGAVGAGGLGAVALTYGYQRFDDVMMYAIVFILSVMVLSLQFLGRAIYRILK
ncbi:methionine ABC transporter permease [Budvicia aquatica]|uniref:Methionine import system permease protein MetP n=2 Tax=Budvicia aquatica TaxID=82979 RepID=A0A484ZBY5_9GAMM|nr:methionine ABC transporter permease [Budvicia aquatica]VFS45952.1 Methionine import system permease protein MetP [Budvicia aquatica]